MPAWPGPRRCWGRAGQCPQQPGLRSPPFPSAPLRSAAPPRARLRSRTAGWRAGPRAPPGAASPCSSSRFIPIGSSEDLCRSNPNSVPPVLAIAREGLPSPARLPEKGPGQDRAPYSGCGLGNSRGKRQRPRHAGEGPALPRQLMPARRLPRPGCLPGALGLRLPLRAQSRRKAD